MMRRQLLALCKVAKKRDNAPLRGGRWGIQETAKPKKKIIQNRRTAKKLVQNRKPHTKQSKANKMVISGTYKANYANS